MDNLLFLIIFILLLMLVIFLGIKRQRQDRRNKIEQIMNAYNDSTSNLFKKNEIISLKNTNFINDKKENDIFIIDEITWNDLNLDTVFEDMNRTVSSAGEEYLFNRLHVLYQSAERIFDFSALSEMLYNDKSTLEKTVGVLLKLGKLKGECVRSIIDSLFEQKQSAIGRDIIYIIGIIISFFFIFIFPGIGVLLLLVSLVASISSYFKGKSRMDTNLKAFCYVFGLIECMKKLEKILPAGYFENEIQLENLLGGSFLISKKDGTTSNIISIFSDYIRMIFHVDLIFYNSRLAQIIKHKDSIVAIFEKIGKIDAAIAVASYKSRFEVTCIPEFTSLSNVYEVVDLYHPLTKNPIMNTVSANGAVLITGSNASGKSTFLKMVGLSIVFAQSMGFALASKLSLSFYRLFSSMALNDNILGEESYYVVESKSLKRICDSVDEYHNIFCIIDEVLKGTNTKERISASSNILKYINDKKAIIFAATHDLELTEILKKHFELYYFTEEYENGNVIFPYKIRNGVSDKGNAIRLLEVLGFDESITKGARELSENYTVTGNWELL